MKSLSNSKNQSSLSQIEIFSLFSNFDRRFVIIYEYVYDITSFITRKSTSKSKNRIKLSNRIWKITSIINKMTYSKTISSLTTNRISRNTSIIYLSTVRVRNEYRSCRRRLSVETTSRSRSSLHHESIYKITNNKCKKTQKDCWKKKILRQLTIRRFYACSKLSTSCSLCCSSKTATLSWSWWT
jgi:hypothetical protein